MAMPTRQPQKGINVRVRSLAVLTAVAALTLPALASGAISVAVSGSTLVITGSQGDDRVGLGYDVAAGAFIVRGNGLVAPACTPIPPQIDTPPGSTRVRCVLSRTDATIQAEMGDGDDWFITGTSAKDVGEEFFALVRARGGAGNDIVFGSQGADLIEGGDGDDLLDAFSGDDFVFGGPGIDRIGDNFGNDVLNAGGQAGDVMFALAGPDGADVFRGGAVSYEKRATGVRASADGVANDGGPLELDNISRGIRVITGGAGDDVIIGSAGNDQLSGGLGNDRLEGRGGRDILRGDGRDLPPASGRGRKGADSLFGGPGPDQLFGDFGPDILNGGPGADRFVGGRGSDRIIARDGAVDQIDCGLGIDRIFSADRGKRPDRVSRRGPSRCEIGAPGPRQ
jgi:Ca2+-binding RTX toxin-like protein